MFELLKSGGFMMIPLVISSIVALAIIMERLFALRASKVLPQQDIETARKMATMPKLNEELLDSLRDNSLIGRVLAVGLESRELPRHIMKENIEEAGRHAVHELERYLPALGTIATSGPLLGLLGTVLGMIAAFSAITKVGMGNPTELASGIAEALVSTAVGLFVAIPALMFYRYFRARVDGFVVQMEQEAMRLVEITNSQRRTTPTPASANPTPRPALNPASALAQAAANQAARGTPK